MKKTLQILVTIFLILSIFLLSCSKEDEIQIEERYKLNLTMEEKQEDYEYFWDFIYNGFPMIEVIERRGVDLEKIKKEEYKKLSEIKSKNAYMDFYIDLCNRITEGKYTGHLGVIDYNRFNSYYRGKYPVIDENGLNPIIDAFYVDEGIDDISPEYIHKMKKKQNNKTDEVKNSKIEWAKNTRLHDSLFADTQILEKDKIAYLRIDSFVHISRDEKYAYYKALDKFFTDTKNYKHLIIDVSCNMGGHPNFWEYIVSVHLRKKDIYYKIYGLYNENDYTKYYFDLYLKHSIRASNKVEGIDIDSVPNVKNANTKIHNKAYIVKSRISSIYSLDDKPRADRKIWVLIGKENYSATDRFANFCKQSGWATLVGENTSGLGSSIFAPEAISLPKSGLLLLSDIAYGLNPDGTCNDEFGIAPDIYTSEGKTALETCLDAIDEYDKNN